MHQSTLRGPIQLSAFEYSNKYLSVQVDKYLGKLGPHFPSPRPSEPSSGCQLCQYRSCHGTSKIGGAYFSRVYLWAALAPQAVPAEFSWCFLFVLLLWMSKMQHRCAEGGFRDAQNICKQNWSALHVEMGSVVHLNRQTLCPKDIF